MSGPYAYRSLPLGVAILAILIGIVGFFYLLAGILLLAFHFAVLGGGLFVGGFLGEVLLTLFGLVLLLVARGLWDRELWALAVTVLVLVLVIIGDILQGALISLGSIVAAFLLVYLILVRDHFR